MDELARPLGVQYAFEMPEAPVAGGGRETRLLLATIVVSVGMLLLLARYRFPEEARWQTVEPVAPLERLAARATYDELANIMADVERRVLPTVVVFRTQSEQGSSFIPAVRIVADRAVAVLARDSRLVGIGSTSAPTILAHDPVRELAVVQLKAADGSAAAASAASTTRPGPRYVALVEASAVAPAVRPVYVGRTDLFSDPRWSEPVLSVAAVQQTVPIGSAMFSLDGGLVGLATETGGTLTVIPADTLRTLADNAPAAPVARGALQIDVQPLTPAVARAAGTHAGVVVTHVPTGVKVDLMPGDVIQSVDGTAVATVAEFQQVTQSRVPGAKVRLDIVRRGQSVSVTLTAVDAETGRSTATGNLGAVMRNVAGAGIEVVTLEPTGAAARAGLRPGDVIIALDSRAAPDAAAMQRAYLAAKPGDSFLVTIRRNGNHRVMAVEKP